ncbi:MAG: hypothetical protein KGQ40_06400, partial [Rhodospirillales bacterium]|nr:hypothetical protein [Rhodospirillales bacterium]
LPRGDALFAVVLARLIYLGVLIIGMAVRKTRLMAVVFLLAPLVLASTLETVHMQFFKLNVFSTFITPFFIITLSRLIAQLPERGGWLSAGAFGIVFTAFSILFFIDRTPTTGYRAASELIRAEERPGDLVYVPQQSMFWGIARYMGTDRHGWQLRVAPQLTDQWKRMYDRAGRRVVAFFDLEPQTQILMSKIGLPLLVGNQSLATAAAAHRVWLITYPRRDLPAGFPPATIGRLVSGPVKRIGFLQIRLYQPAE